MKKNVLIVDGLNYLFRAYFGVPEVVKSKNGFQTNAIVGFFSFLRTAVELSNAHYILVVFDSENAVSKKQIEFPEYKSNRVYDDSNANIFDQLIIIKEILSLMRIQYVEEYEVEADDLIGAYTKNASINGCCVFIASNDYDFMQLVADNVYVIRSNKGVQVLYNPIKVFDQFGVPPEVYRDFIALKGDKSDNIIGVPGIGKKIARELINKYLSIENLLINKSTLKGNLKAKIELYADNILRYKKIITINLDNSILLIPIENFSYSSDKLFTKTNEYLLAMDL